MPTFDKTPLSFNNKGFEFQTRYIDAFIKSDEGSDKYAQYKYAAEFAKSIDLTKRTFAIVNGSFIFGDFIEALLVEHQIKAINMQIATLSMSQENVDSLAGLMRQGYIENLTLIGSDFFIKHEENNLVPYIYDQLDIDNRFQLLVARVHTKIVIFETSKGNKFVIHGSANLRSSGNCEQVVVEMNAPLYDFNFEFNNKIGERHKTINHKIPKK
jgi:hypothetical protein